MDVGGEKARKGGEVGKVGGGGGSRRRTFLGVCVDLDGGGGVESRASDKNFATYILSSSDYLSHYVS